MTNTSDIIMAGQAVDGFGALTGWRGKGSLTGKTLAEVVAAADLPPTMLPTPKSAKAYAGQAVRTLDNLGYVVRAARASEKSKLEQQIRLWDARWTVGRSMAATADVGESMGPTVLTVTLVGGELKCQGDAVLARRVMDDYQVRRENEVFNAGEVTTWLADLLMRHFGATGYGTGYYLPPTHRSAVSKLIAQLSCRWGRRWMMPLLPVGSMNELRQGIANGLIEDVQNISDSLDSLRESARTNKRSEIQAGQAAQLLRGLKEIQDRVAAYRELCGDATISPVVLSITLLHETLSKLTNDTSVRFAMLDLDGPISTPTPKTVSPAEKAAEKAASLKRATTGGLADALRAVTTATELAALLPELRKVPEGKVKAHLRDLYRAAQQRLVAPTKGKVETIRRAQPIGAPGGVPIDSTPIVLVPAAKPEPNDTDLRFSQLELD
jgi:hypothetical protein